MKGREWLFIAILAFVIAVVWVTVAAVSRTRQSTIPPDVERIMTPLNPNLDKDFFMKLKERTP